MYCRVICVALRSRNPLLIWLTSDPLRTRTLNKSAFSDPASLTLGNSAYALSGARDIGIISEDISAQKNFYIREKLPRPVPRRYAERLQPALSRRRRHQPDQSVVWPGYRRWRARRRNTEDSRSIQLTLRLDF